EGISLFQNIPNPFKQSTIIPFQISERSDIEIRIVDINGKLIYETRANYNKGYHEIEIQKNQLDRSGIYYYQLKSNKYNLFRRMILID
ncbi:MAG: T9SS type A sorting domain-containing protein, partial [Saprospiraceae bacterium]